MKMCKKEERNVTTKTVKSGISLIVLVITIIVIIILSTAILVSVVSNNPIDEANKARYESDRDNMQAVFTNTVAKVMAQNQGTVSVTAGQINSVISGVKETTGQVSYTVTNAVNSANASGTIVFDKGENTDTVYYTGKQLPIYKAGVTKWYVSEEGEILLEVAQNKYGEGEITFAPGAYDANNVMLASWDELVNDYGLDISSDYTAITAKTSATSMYSVLNNNQKLSATTKIVIGNSVTTIGNYAFCNCNNLVSITMPNTLTSIKNGAFQECKSLISVEIPESVTTIGNFAFQTCVGLKSILLPDTLTSLGLAAFSGCIELISIEIPRNITSLGMGIFNGCTGLESVVIPDSVVSIGSQAFYDCDSLTSITIPKSVTSVKDGYTFGACDSLVSIKVEDGNTVYDSRDNCNAIIETATNKLITGCKTSVIPNTITSIGKQAFINCTGLTSVIIPESVTNIENNAFIGCSGLTSIKVEDGNTVYDSRDNCNAIIETTTNKLTKGCKNSVIPNTVVTIGSTAFRESIGLTAVIIPESVVKIEEQAFYDCDSLTSIIISKSVTSIGVNVFSDCNSLISIKVDEENTVYDSRDNCNAIIEKSSNKLISGCKTSAIPNTVTNISNYAFYYCTELESITIPESVTAIGSFAFVSCDNLKTIYYKGTATGAPWGATSATVVSEY